MVVWAFLKWCYEGDVAGEVPGEYESDPPLGRTAVMIFGWLLRTFRCRAAVPAPVLSCRNADGAEAEGVLRAEAGETDYVSWFRLQH